MFTDLLTIAAGRDHRHWNDHECHHHGDGPLRQFQHLRGSGGGPSQDPAGGDGAGEHGGDELPRALCPGVRNILLLPAKIPDHQPVAAVRHDSWSRRDDCDREGHRLQRKHNGQDCVFDRFSDAVVPGEPHQYGRRPGWRVVAGRGG